MEANQNIAILEMDELGENYWLNQVNYGAGQVKFTAQQQQILRNEFGVNIPTRKGLRKQLEKRQLKLEKEAQKQLRAQQKQAQKDLLKQQRQQQKLERVNARQLAKQRKEQEDIRALKLAGFLAPNQKNIRIRKLGSDIETREQAVEIARNIATGRLRSFVRGITPFYTPQQWEGLIPATIDRSKPFEVVLTSGVIDGLVSAPFRFNHLQHFRNWINTLNETQSNSGNVIQYIALDGAYERARLTFNQIAGGGDQTRAYQKKITGEYFDFQVKSMKSRQNNCGLECIKYFVDENSEYEFDRNWKQTMRKELGVKEGQLLTPQHLRTTWSKFAISKSRLLVIIDKKYNGNIDMENCCYIMYDNEHYTVIMSAKDTDLKDKKTKRGEMYFDFETRPVLSLKYYATDEKRAIYPLRDTICVAYYRDYKTTEWKKVVFTTNQSEGRSALQFLDFMRKQARNGKHYNVFAHNGSNFDYYLLLSVMRDWEIEQSRINTRGLSLICINYCSHCFKDTCCFLTNSLDNLCKNYKVKNPKKTEFVLRGETLTSKNLCFYKPNLDFDEFMNLENTEPDYWFEYVDYCYYDCVSLSQVWGIFCESINAVLEEMSNKVPNATTALMSKCKVMNNITVGGLAKKMLEALNRKNSKFSFYQQFIGFGLDADEDKYNFIKKFKRGGISHCNQAGKHNESVVSFDITSQYPSAMIYMKIPAGKSEWVNHYRPHSYGYYRIKNLTLKGKKFRPIAYSCGGESLNWSKNWKEEDELYVGSELLKYMLEIESFDFEVVEALVSKSYVKGEQLFGAYVNTLFAEKAKEDEYKKNKDDKYNPAYREVIKLLLNSVSGKLVEDPDRHKTLRVVAEDNAKNTMNGCGVSMERQDGNINKWIGAGCCVYDYSKILLWNYVMCLPKGSDDIIHIETDSIYFSAKHKDAFLENVSKIDTKPVGIGKELGNMCQEHTSVGVSYFIGKKMYYLMDEDGEEAIKAKGVPFKTIDEHGNDVRLLDVSFYERLYAGEAVEKVFATLKKHLFPIPTITSSKMSRTTKALIKQREWW